MKAAARRPWGCWVPTLYFFEGLPYFIVNTVSVVILKRLGMDNGSLAMYTGLLYLPWVIKPLWSPFVDVLRTKRWWILLTQAIVCACVWMLSFYVNSDVLGKGGDFYIFLGIFWLMAFSSATHDIAADGFYMLALNEHRATQLVGVRNTFYRVASVFGQGVIVWMAGVIELKMGNIPAAWSMTMRIVAVLLLAIFIWNLFAVPAPAADAPRSESRSMKGVARSLWLSFASFFKKKGIVAALLFMLLYRLPESLIIKMINPFLLDPVDSGGLGLATDAVGMAYGTAGAMALIAGGILGGFVAGKYGLKKCMWPMALSLTLPCLVFVWMAFARPSSLFLITSCICLDQFGYGFGFTAYTLYLMYFSRGEYKTSHYSLCTAFMALGMMLPGMVAGYLQECLGYRWFFIVVILCFMATFAAVWSVKVDSEYGKKAD